MGSRPIQFRSGVSARVLLVVTPDAWSEASRRSQLSAPLRMGDRPYTAEDAAAAFGALTQATTHRVIAEGDELLVEVAISESEMPPKLYNEWRRLKEIVENARAGGSFPLPARFQTVSEEERTKKEASGEGNGKEG